MGIRVERDVVGLAASIAANGDLEVFFGATELDALLDALSQARRILR
jgi:hypothetical protein